MINFIRKKDFNRDYLEYKLNEMDIVDTFCQGMIENNELPGIISSSFQQIDNDKYFYFDVSALDKLDDFLNTPIIKKDLIKTILSMVNTFELAEDYMIDQGCFILQPDYIFIDQYKNVKLLYLPLENIKNTFNLTELIKHILMTAKYQIGEDPSYVIKILNYLNSRNAFSLGEIKTFLLNINSQKQADQKIEVQQTPIEPVNNQLQDKSHENKQMRIIQPEVRVEPRKIPQPHNDSRIPVKKDLVEHQDILNKDKNSQNIEEIKEDSEEEIVISKRNDGIPTLKNKKIIKTSKVKNEKKKAGLFNKDKEKKSDRKSKIPTAGGKGKIPTITKRKEAIVNPENNQIKRDIVMPYSPDAVDSTQFAGTTVLGNGTTVLTEGTTLLIDQDTVSNYPILTRLSNNQKMFVSKPVFSIGRDSTRNDFAISDNSAVSSEHAEIRLENGRYYISDLKSTNKTFVDGNVLKPGYKMELYSGSRIRIANEDFEFEL